MNFRMIVHIIGHIIKIEGLLFLVPVITALVYNEATQGRVYGVIGAALFVFGFLITRKKPKNTILYLKEGCVTTALSWIVLSVFGAIPLLLTGEILSFTDAVFEIVSGFTTTGSSILTDVEALSHASLMWRSFTHWVGGMGILIFLLAVIPLTGGSNVNLMKAESPGPQVDKSLPQVKTTALLLYVIYSVLTALEFIILLITKLPVFDAICMTFGTAGTGGFGVLSDSCASYPIASQWVIAIFMILFGINFNVYVMLVFRRFKKAFISEEVWTYLGFIVVAVVIITINILDKTAGFIDALTKSTFSVASTITTTGYANTDFNTWPTIAKVILVFLMFSGACAGSTAGGIKVSRIIIAFKVFRREVSSFLHPREVKTIRMDDQVVSDKTVRSVTIYFITYAVIFAFSLFWISFDGHDLVTSFTAIVATFNNIGPGLEMVGPTGNFAFFSIPCKWVLIFDMLAGRLEIFPMLMLFHPSNWRGVLIRHRRGY